MNIQYLYVQILSLRQRSVDTDTRGHGRGHEKFSHRGHWKFPDRGHGRGHVTFSKNRGHGHDADKPRTRVSTDLWSQTIIRRTEMEWRIEYSEQCLFPVA